MRERERKRSRMIDAGVLVCAEEEEARGWTY